MNGNPSIPFKGMKPLAVCQLADHLVINLYTFKTGKNSRVLAGVNDRKPGWCEVHEDQQGKAGYLLLTEAGNKYATHKISLKDFDLSY